MIKLILKSIGSRWVISLLLIITIAVGTALISVVETMRDAAKSNFTNTISGTDLIVASRNSDLSILLNSVFLRGEPLYALPSEVIDEVNKMDEVAWSAPISLGDYYRGFPVIGTTTDFLLHFTYGRNRTPLEYTVPIRRQELLSEPFHAVVGSEVAKQQQLFAGEKIYLSHGKRVIDKSQQHSQNIIIDAILTPTGTPIDRAVLINLSTIDELHIGWENGHATESSITLAKMRRAAEKNKAEEEMHGHDEHDHEMHSEEGDEHDHETHTLEGDEHDHETHTLEGDEHDHETHTQEGDEHDHETHTQESDEHDHETHTQESDEHHAHDTEVISAILVGLKIPQLVFSAKEKLEKNEHYTISAVIPSVALLEFWQLMGSFEFGLLWISIAVIISAFVGMLAVAMASISQRRREIALYRAIGANKKHIYQIMSGEAFFIGLFGALLGIIVGYLILTAIEPIIISMAGIRIDDYAIWFKTACLSLLIIPLCCVVVNLMPLGISYRQQLIKGLVAP